MASLNARGCLALASTMSAVSACLAGLVGAYTTTHYGRELAMGAAIYGGNTEPRVPYAPYPWWLYGVGLGVAVLGLIVERTFKRHPLLGHALMHGGAYLTAVVPFYHLYLLVERT